MRPADTAGRTITGVLMEDDINDEYLTYNGFNRPALFMGIPILLFLSGLTLLLISFFIGVLTVGFYGLILPVAIVMWLMSLKVKCAKDPNALAVSALKRKGLILKGLNANNTLKWE